MGKVYIGKIVHSKSFDELEVIPEGFIAVEGGKIYAMGPLDHFQFLLRKNDMDKVTLSEHQFLMPGFIDCHIHAPQAPNIGVGLDMDLMSWLTSYTFPLESQYKDTKFAQQVYSAVVRDTLASGTTCACYFATIYNESNKVLTEEIIRQGQRAFVGKVSSNRLCPDDYIESGVEESVRDNIEFIEYVMEKKVNLVKPIITPRFAISCDMPLMKKLGELAGKYGLIIQSHISESLKELDSVKSFYPENKHYADVYDEAKLLIHGTVLAHGVHLEDDELEVLSQRGTSIAHCPCSNTNLGSGMCDVKRLVAANVKVCLGTDISGGNRIGIYDVMRAALDVSHHLNMMKKQDVKGTGRVATDSKANEEYQPLNYKQALYLATLGGAKALTMSHRVGNFVVGKEFDALIVDVSVYPTNRYQLPAVLTQDKSPEDLILEMVQKFVYVGDDRNIQQVFVAGERVK